MYEIEIPQQYEETLLLRCAEYDIPLEKLVETAIIHYMERKPNNE